MNFAVYVNALNYMGLKYRIYDKKIEEDNKKISDKFFKDHPTCKNNQTSANCSTNNPPLSPSVLAVSVTYELTP